MGVGIRKCPFTPGTDGADPTQGLDASLSTLRRYVLLRLLFSTPLVSTGPIS